jgi:hypothetical protein
MPKYIPFVNTDSDVATLKSCYSEAKIVRVTLEKIGGIRRNLPSNIKLWLDGGVDGYEHHIRKEKDPIPSYLAKHVNSDRIFEAAHIAKPNQTIVDAFVASVLNECAMNNPHWLTIPLLPVTDSNDRNQINLLLAKATLKWKLNKDFKGALITPLIFTHKQQVMLKTHWKPRVDATIRSSQAAQADGIWIADKSLADQKAEGSFVDRFPSLISLHEYLKNNTRAFLIGGPYWGLNLVLWARGIIDYFAIGVGGGYQYHLPGGILHRGTSRIALPPLRRCVVVSPELKNWLNTAVTEIGTGDPAFDQFKAARNELAQCLNEVRKGVEPILAKNQVAIFYKKWMDKINAIDPAGRALALYQDLSSAFVLGKHLKTLPASCGNARRPEKVAEYLMLNCL